MIDRELCRRSGLQYILDNTSCASPFGRELCAHPVLYDNSDALRRELARVKALSEYRDLSSLTAALDEPLSRLKDIRGSLRRCGEGEALSLTELFEVKNLLLSLQTIRALYEAACPLEGLSFSDSTPARTVLDPKGEGKRSFSIDDAATPALFALRREKRQVEAELYKTGDEESRTALRLRRQELCAGEEAEERRVCAALSGALAPCCAALGADCAAAGHLDLLLRKAALARKSDTSVPDIRPGEIEFTAMTNPAIAADISARGGAFVPVSLTLGRGAAVITGANMGGKTVALRTLALNVLLAMSGWPVFAEGGALPMVSHLLFLSGDAESSADGLSSFGGEIVRLRETLASLDESTLLLLDEPARGTNPEEGAAIVRALTEYLNARPGFALIATHYDGVARRAGRQYRINGLRHADLEALGRELVAAPDGAAVIARCMDYGLYPCPPEEPCPREAVTVCRLLGLPQELTEKIDRCCGEAGETNR